MLHTPALELGILAGVTRETLIAAAAEAGMRLVEGEYPRERLAGAAEVFTSSSVREVMPVVRLDGEQIGDGASGGRRGPDAVRAPARRRRG